ncbi:deoxynucleoside kinase [Mycoplasmopsis felifaucium]|uniref:deoxynucleoside kinase n=1 Tax=Mycoplasmopsis felifaucium TaxID=35768 RepID=UPI0004891194|nr:deoxynucleoside kinase [Mycoplasmopsis felifaucium]
MIIAISGMISSGKSTLTKNLKSAYQNSMMLEEFDENDQVFNTYLKWCYEQKPNLDISFQSYIVESLTELNKHSEAKFMEKYSHTNGFLFLDRFILEHYIFAVVTLEKKDKKYLEAFDSLFNCIYDSSTAPDLAIFLKISWNTFKTRIYARGRSVEIENFNQNEAYFKRLHELYFELFEKLVNKYNIPFKIIESDYKTDKEVLKEAKKTIDNFDFSNSNRF